LIDDIWIVIVNIMDQTYLMDGFCIVWFIVLLFDNCVYVNDDNYFWSVSI